MRRSAFGVAWLLLAGVPTVAAADRVGDGEEADVRPAYTIPEPPGPTRATAPAKELPSVPAVANPEPRTPIVPLAVAPEATAPRVPIAPPLPAKEFPATPVANPESAPAQVVPMEEKADSRAPTATAPPAEDLTADLTADLPGAVTPKPRNLWRIEMEDYRPPELSGPEARKAFKIIGELRKLITQIADDLDAGGVERTRLIFSAESLSKEASNLAEIWPKDAKFRDLCASAKRSVLVLEEELRGEPRRWSHVRWAFREAQDQVKALRAAAAEQAGAQPKMVRVVDKKGRESFVEAPRDPAQVKREEDERRRRELREERDRQRKYAEEADKKANGGDIGPAP